MHLAVARSMDRSVILLATVALASKQYELPSKSFWDSLGGGRAFLLIGLTILAGVFGILSPFEAYSRRGMLAQRVTMRRQILTAFGQLLSLGTAANRSVPISDPGLHIWKKKHTLKHPVQGELRRVATYRLGSTPATRTMRPTRGVGVVGLCWQLNQEVSKNVEQLVTLLTDQQSFETYRQEHGLQAVMGLSWEDFNRFSHRGAVFASPIRNARSSFVGCISFDAAHGYDDLNCHRMWHELNTLCTMISQDGFENV